MSSKIILKGSYFFSYILLYLFFSNSGFAEEYNLIQILEAAKNNSGFLKQQDINSKILEKEISEININYYPQFNIEGQASYQSDVFKLPFNTPLIAYPELRKDQYNFSLSIHQLIYESGITEHSKKLKAAKSESNILLAESKIRNIKEQIINLYFSALKVKNIIQSINLTIELLENTKKQIKSLIENGIKDRSALNSIEIQIYIRNQNLVSQNEDYFKIIKNIEHLTGLKNIEIVQIDDNLKINNYEFEINRDEIKSLSKLKKVNTESNEILNRMLMPQISAFAKLGASNPNIFNMFEQDWSAYYFAGIKFFWKPFTWMSGERNTEISELQNLNLDYEKFEFLKQLKISMELDVAEIKKNEIMLLQDIEILNLQKKNISDKNSQFINGTAAINELITEINALEQYEINHNLHKLMIIAAKYNLKIKSGSLLEN